MIGVFALASGCSAINVMFSGMWWRMGVCGTRPDKGVCEGGDVDSGCQSRKLKYTQYSTQVHTVEHMSTVRSSTIESRAMDGAQVTCAVQPKQSKREEHML